MLANPTWKAKGLKILNEGTHTLTLPNGAHITLYTSPYTPAFQNWAFAYERDVDRFNPPTLTYNNNNSNDGAKNPVPDWPAVDIMVTHGPPRGCWIKWPGRGVWGVSFWGGR